MYIDYLYVLPANKTDLNFLFALSIALVCKILFEHILNIATMWVKWAFLLAWMDEHTLYSPKLVQKNCNKK